jgi:hypothetical protein
MTSSTGNDPQAPTAPSPLLDPADRDEELLTGLIMALTFTCTLSVTDSNSAVRTVILGALACNVAWGLVDAVMYLLDCLSDRGGTSWHSIRCVPRRAWTWRGRS